MSTTSVVTDLVGKRVTVWHLPEWGGNGSAMPGMSGVVRAVSVFDRERVAFCVLLQIDRAHLDLPEGALTTIVIDETTTVVPEPAG